MNIKKYFIFSLIVLTLALGVSFLLPKNDIFADLTHPTLSGGSGTSSSPYKVSTIDDLRSLANYVNGGGTLTHKEGRLITRTVQNYYSMTQSINLGGNELSAIGTNAHPFSAIFDGKGYCLTNGKFSTSELFGGVFGVLSGTAKNLKVYNIEISLGGQQGYVGGIAGRLFNGSVDTCASIWLTFPNSEMYAAGGIVGMGSGTITSCYNLVGLGDVNSYQIAGGIIGMSGTGTKVEYSYNKGNVYARSAAGGIVGGTLDSITIENCYNLGNVTTSGVNAADSVWKTSTMLPGGQLINENQKAKDNCKYSFYLAGSLDGGQYYKCDKGESYVYLKTVTNGGAAGGILGNSGAGTATVKNSYNTGAISGGMERTFLSVKMVLFRNDGASIALESDEILIDYDCFSGGICGAGKISASNSFSTTTYTISNFTDKPNIVTEKVLIGGYVNAYLDVGWYEWLGFWYLSCDVGCQVVYKDGKLDYRCRFGYYELFTKLGVEGTSYDWKNQFPIYDISRAGFAQNGDSAVATRQGTGSSKDDLKNRFNSGEWFLPSDVINSGYPALKRFFWESAKTSFN